VAKLSGARLYIIFIKELKQRKWVRQAIALFLFPVAYTISLIHPYYGFNLLVKIFLTELSSFDRTVALRLNTILPIVLSRYLSATPEFLKHPCTPKNPEADYIVLKSYVSEKEKGLISIHWRWQIDIFVRNYEIKEILRRYMIILGPDCFGSEWTFPFLALMYKGRQMKESVFTSSKHKRTQERLSLMGFKAIPHGTSSDYINPERFLCLDSINKAIDVIMVANWNIPIKRHYVLFKALEKVIEPLNVVFVGFPGGDYILGDIKELESRYHIKRHNIRYYENLDPSSVNDLLNRSKMSVITSLMEGGNRACFESFFANTPSIILGESIGVPVEYFNSKTGIVCKGRKLHVAIENMLRHYKEFSPREWALANISPRVTREKINVYLKGFALKNGMSWTTDIAGKQWRGQSFEYVDEEFRNTFQGDYQFIRSCFKYRESKSDNATS
jgi:hypothetical protein